MDIISFLPPVIALAIAVIIHEFMHAWTAFYFGDPTPKLDKRISINPINHIDPIGTILLPLFLIIAGSRVLFGWAKPVRINEQNFNNPRRDSVIVSLAGPFANLAMALIFTIPLKLGIDLNPLMESFFGYAVMINIVLLVFNLIPIPPLDGSKVLYYFLPPSVNIRVLEMYGPFLLLLLLFIPGSPLFVVMGSIVGLVLRILGLESIL